MIVGNTKFNNIKTKILYLDKNNNNVIKDIYKNVILKTKFQNYNNIMYKNRNTKHYCTLWNNKQVYNLPIDIVYTWVNGKDQKWKDRKYQFTGIKSDGDKRVENVDELKYSLMSIYKYAPWINNIYIVVDDIQVPEFDLGNKVKIIKHSDIIKHEYLPTYNSLVIDSNLHHIEGLTENFLNFNDDMFLGNYISKEEILNKVCGTYTHPKNLSNSIDSYNIANVKNYKMLKSKFPKIKSFIPWHQARICKKSLMYDLENMFPFEFQELYKHRTRIIDNDKLSIQKDFCITGLQQMYGLYIGEYKLKNDLSEIFVEMGGNKKEIYKLYDVIETKPKFFCLNNIENVNDTLLFFNTFLNDLYNLKNKIKFINYCNLHKNDFVNNNIQKKTNLEAVLIEFRVLPHIEYLLKNTINKLDTNWSHTVVRNDDNYHFIKKLCDRISSKITIIKLNVVIKNINDYNNLLLTKNFWNLFYGEKILIYQEDSVMFHGIIKPFLVYDYIGAPWKNDIIKGGYGGNGGFSLRTKKIMLDCLNNNPPVKKLLNNNTLDKEPEDYYFSKTIYDFKLGLLANREISKTFSQESIIGINPVGGHNFWLAK